MWARKFSSVYVLVAALALLGFAIGLASGRDNLYVGNHAYGILRASTPAERARGLSGHNTLPPNEVMLFVYDHPAVQCFWMKDMAFSIDMIWLNNAKQVVRVMPDVSPATFPRSFCAPAQYVAEFGAGQVRAADIHVGQKFEF